LTKLIHLCFELFFMIINSLVGIFHFIFQPVDISFAYVYLIFILRDLSINLLKFIDIFLHIFIHFLFMMPQCLLKLLDNGFDLSFLEGLKFVFPDLVIEFAI